MTQYTLNRFNRNDAECPVCGTGFTSIKGFGPHFHAKHPGLNPVIERIRADFTHPPDVVLHTLHVDAGIPVSQISKRFDYPRRSLMKAFDQLGVERDSRTGLEYMWQDRYDEIAATMSENAALGAAGRERNGMEGVTGQDSPHWRGGKSVYDAVKKQLGHESWHTSRRKALEASDNRCETCGGAPINRRTLDVHHIVPVMAGGTNEQWNLMVLCESCHHRAEWTVRQLSEFDPVLVDG